MKDDDEGDDEGFGKVVMKVDDEGSEWLIISCLRGFEDKQTDGQTNKHTFVNVELLSQLKILGKMMISTSDLFARKMFIY